MTLALSVTVIILQRYREASQTFIFVTMTKRTVENTIGSQMSTYLDLWHYLLTRSIDTFIIFLSLPFIIKAALSGLRQFLATESP